MAGQHGYSIYAHDQVVRSSETTMMGPPFTISPGNVKATCKMVSQLAAYHPVNQRKHQNSCRGSMQHLDAAGRKLLAEPQPTTAVYDIMLYRWTGTLVVLTPVVF